MRFQLTVHKNGGPGKHNIKTDSIYNLVDLLDGRGAVPPISGAAPPVLRATAGRLSKFSLD